MCRFLLIKSKNAIQPKKLLNEFALMCKNNSEWQGDGWGLSWKVEDGEWKIDKSVKPIWEESERFNAFPKSHMFAIHARGASFPKHKDNIDFNQPYISNDLCFVFNGELYGVTLKADGAIGSQKIFSLVKQNLDKNNPIQTLQKVQDMLLKNSKSILGCNIGFIYENGLYASCNFSDKKEYYTVRYYSDEQFSIICSEKISNYPWKSMKNGEVIKL